MKKILPFSMLLFTLTKGVQAQTISPAVTNEYCPSTDITFTVSVPGTSPTVASWTNGPIVVQGAYNITTSGSTTTFNFKGRFQDKNVNQIFKINYARKNNSDTQYYPSFKNIKSLYFDNSYSSSCLPIQLNQSTATVPLCQTANIPVSFTNIKWSTSGESPAYCFGTITTYEYLLPVGWKIGSTVSTGSNWIAGGNSATVVSDLTHGAGGYIKVRPSNNCASGLVNGYTPAQMYISRPAPTLTISGPPQFCTTGNYQIASLPTGATVNWYISPAPFFNYSQNNNILTVNRTTYDGNINITATVTTCQVFSATPKSVRVGGNPVTVTATQTACDDAQFYVSGAGSGATYNWSSAHNTILYNGNSTTATTTSPSISATISAQDFAVVNTINSCSQSVYASSNPLNSYPRQINGLYEVYSNGDQIIVSVNTYPLDSYYKWYINGVVDYEGQNASDYSTVYQGVGRNIVCGDNTMRVEVTTCGTVTSSDAEHFNKMGNCGFSKMASNVEVFPNPATNQTTVKLSEINEAKMNLNAIKSIKIIDKSGILKTVTNYSGNTKSINLNLSNLPLGVYYIEVSDGIQKTVLPLNVQK